MLSLHSHIVSWLQLWNYLLTAIRNSSENEAPGATSNFALNPIIPFKPSLIEYPEQKLRSHLCRRYNGLNMCAINCYQHIPVLDIPRWLLGLKCQSGRVLLSLTWTCGSISREKIFLKHAVDLLVNTLSSLSCKGLRYFKYTDDILTSKCRVRCEIQPSQLFLMYKRHGVQCEMQPSQFFLMCKR
jgi:hypothetical protein